jgi:hypothetical protein
MSLCHCSLCSEPLNSPVFYKGVPYGWSCVNKAIAMDNANPDAVRKAKATIKKTSNVFRSFKVDRVETISTEWKGTIHVYSSEYKDGYIEMCNWWGEGFSLLNKVIRYNEERNEIIVDFGFPGVTKVVNGQKVSVKASKWNFKDKWLIRHGVIPPPTQYDWRNS